MQAAVSFIDKEGKNLPQLDITAPTGPVVIECDSKRGIIYVHIEGISVLRICRITGEITVADPAKRGLPRVLRKADV